MKLVCLAALVSVSGLAIGCASSAQGTGGEGGTGGGSVVGSGKTNATVGNTVSSTVTSANGTTGNTTVTSAVVGSTTVSTVSSTTNGTTTSTTTVVAASTTGTNVGTTGVTSVSANASSSTGLSACDTGVHGSLLAGATAAEQQICTTCAQCSEGDQCSTEFTAYSNSANVTQFQNCNNACAATDDACFTACDNTYPAASAAFQDFISCAICGECIQNCDEADSCTAPTTTSSASSSAASTGSGSVGTCDTGLFGSLLGGATAAQQTTCTTCVTCSQSDFCTTQWNSYFADTNTAAYSNCESSCTAGDTSCFDLCASTYPTADAKFNTALSCSICQECTENCDAVDTCM